MRTSLLLLACLALPAFGQITAACDTDDPRCSGGTSISITTVQGGPSDFGFAVEIGGSGTWTLANNNCFFNYRSNDTTGTAPATIYVWYFLSGNTVTPQSRSCALQFATGVTLTINETVVARNPLPFVSNPDRDAGGSPGCTAGQSGEQYASVCDTADPRPGGNRAGWPTAVGGTFTDPNFGGVFTQITNQRTVHAYPNLNTIDPTNTYVVATSLDVGGTRLWRLDGGGGTDYNTLSSDCTSGGTIWSKVNPGTFWCVPGSTNTIKQYHLGTAPNIVDDGVIYTDPVGNITNGGTGHPSNDDWGVFFSTSCSTTCGMGAHVVAIDLNNPSTVVEYELADLPSAITSYDYFSISTGKTNNYRYVWGNAARLVIWRFLDSDSTMTVWQNGTCNWEVNFRNNVATDTWAQTGCNSADYLAGGHADVFQVAGEQFRITSNVTRVAPNFLTLAGTMQVSKGADMNLARERGGGLSFRTMQSADLGCATSAPICTGNVSLAFAGKKTSFRISGVSCVSTTCTATTTTAHGFSTSNVVLIGSVQVCTGINGSQTITATPTSTTFEFTATIGGSCTANTGDVTLDTEWTNENSPNNDIAVARWLTPDIVHIRRLAKTNTVGYSLTWYGGAGYWDSPHGMLSDDGTKVVVTANGGVPDAMADFVLDTGFDVDQSTPPSCFDKNGNCITASPADTAIAITVDAMNAGDCVASAYTSLNYDPNTAAAANVTLSGGGAGLRSGSITSLSNGTPYYVAVQCDNYWYAVSEAPVTPAPVSTALKGTAKIKGSVGIR